MTSKLASSSISAPGFMGLNTQDSFVDLSSGFATVANNCVIDKFGRIGARKGWTALHTAVGALAGETIDALFELVDNSGVSHIIAAGANKLWKLSSGTLTELTYGGGGVAPTITASKWQGVNLSGALWLYQAGHDPLIYDPVASTTTYKRISEVPGYAGTVQQSNCALAAFGRTWTGGATTNLDRIQFSDILAGQVFSGGTSGFLELDNVWSIGGDKVVALASHNNFLYIFGEKQILIYQGADDPATMALADNITGIGCVARDSVVNTGSDILFLSDAGVRSLQRTIQEKSAPMRDISLNVRDDLVNAVFLGSTTNICAGYSDKEALYLLSIPSAQVVYAFDMRAPLQNGSNRATTWTNMVPTAVLYTVSKSLYFGLSEFVGNYTGWNDNGNPYTMSYTTTYFDLGQPTDLKIMKKIGITTIGGAGYTINLKHAFDFSDVFRYRQFILGGKIPDEYNIGEYNIAEYGGSVFNQRTINVGGAGKTLQVGIDVSVDNQPISLQKLDVYLKLGKVDV